MSCRYQKHAIQHDERIRHLEQESKVARFEITKLEAVIGRSTIIVREEYITHGLCLNSRSKMRLTNLTVESIHGGHVPSRNSSIPVIIHARVSPFSG
jgi:hypothetical protein